MIQNQPEQRLCPGCGQLRLMQAKQPLCQECRKPQEPGPTKAPVQINVRTTGTKPK